MSWTKKEKSRMKFRFLFWKTSGIIKQNSENVCDANHVRGPDLTSLHSRMTICEAPSTQQRLSKGQIIGNLMCFRHWAHATGIKTEKTQSQALKNQICKRIILVGPGEVLNWSYALTISKVHREDP